MRWTHDHFGTLLMVLGWIYGGLPLPGAGTVAATVASWQANRELERIELTMAELDAALKAVKRDFDEAFARGPEGAVIADRVIESATLARNAKKRRFYAAAFARSLTFTRPAEAERELMLDTLDELEESHLALLAAIAADRQPPYHPRDYLHPGRPSYRVASDALPGTSTEFLDRAWEDLARARIVESAAIPKPAPERGVPNPNPVTAFGWRFIAFIQVDEP